MTVPIRPIHLFADSQLLYWSPGGNPLLRAVREGIDKDQPKAAYVGASNGDQAEYFAIFEGAMALIGIGDCRMILSHYPDEDQDYLRQADIILLAGGDVANGLQVMNETGMSQDVRLKYYDSTTLIGVSAGAVQLGTRGWRAEDPDVDDLTDALGLVPYVVDAHDEMNQWSRLKKVLSLSPANTHGLALPTGGGVLYHPDQTIEPVRYPLTTFCAGDEAIIETLLRPLDGTGGGVS